MCPMGTPEYIFATNRKMTLIVGWPITHSSVRNYVRITPVLQLPRSPARRKSCILIWRKVIRFILNSNNNFHECRIIFFFTHVPDKNSSITISYLCWIVYILCGYITRENTYFNIFNYIITFLDAKTIVVNHRPIEVIIFNDFRPHPISCTKCVENYFDNSKMWLRIRIPTRRKARGAGADQYTDRSRWIGIYFMKTRRSADRSCATTCEIEDNWHHVICGLRGTVLIGI